jgi:ribosomal protein L20
MPRVKRGNKRRAKRKKILNLASGYRLTKGKLYRAAREAVQKGLAYAYRDRRNKKRDFRSLWILRINAAARKNDVSYSAKCLQIWLFPTMQHFHTSLRLPKPLRISPQRTQSPQRNNVLESTLRSLRALR